MIAIFAALITVGGLYGIGLCLIPDYELGEWND